MKRILLSLTVLSTMLLVACEDKKEGDSEESKDNKGKTEEVKNLSIDTDASYIEWKATGGVLNEDVEKGHSGKVRFASGSISVKGDQIIGGIAKVNVFSIYDADIDGDNLAYLIGHLSSPDFFAVDSTGMGAPTFTVMGYENAMLKGELDINGQTASVEFPAVVTNDENGVTITSAGSFNLDMTKYGMPYWAQEKEPVEDQPTVILDPMMEFSFHIVGK